MREKQAIARYISMTDRLMSGEAAAVCAPDAIRVGKVFRETAWRYGAIVRRSGSGA